MEIKLAIAYDSQTGKLSLSGPIQDVVGCYGLLERAKDAIRKQAEAGSPNIIVPDVKPADPIPAG